ncbi:DUF6650 family protein [Brevundimonas sp.]|uniref:DUF6650 family protein n=1 Tax=Brevundimonas sp. TaxID=1871086 RepID=UPI002D441335|nr:DUF6650 family protein [Brevundimonas sp.]HYC68890.1 DUF6650 family protein [Brevundimonas sp.]
MRNPFRPVARVSAETARRITGISTPLGGVQWADPGPSDRDRVRELLIELEDRRVLYNPDWLEVRSQVDESINEIRGICTEALKRFSPRDYATQALRVIRAACRRYLDDTQIEFRFAQWDTEPNGLSAGAFLALGAFRATVGQEVARLAAQYDLDVEGELASILPRPDE